MKILCTFVLAVAAGFCIAADPTWNPADAVKEAEQDIRTGHIKFYWSGSIASFPVGVPFEVAKKYPQANAGIGCVTNDIPLRERQEEYVRRPWRKLSKRFLSSALFSQEGPGRPEGQVLPSEIFTVTRVTTKK